MVKLDVKLLTSSEVRERTGFRSDGEWNYFQAKYAPELSAFRAKKGPLWLWSPDAIDVIAELRQRHYSRLTHLLDSIEGKAPMLENSRQDKWPSLEEIRPLKEVPTEVRDRLANSRAEQEEASGKFNERHPDLDDECQEWMQTWLGIHSPDMILEGMSYTDMLEECYLHYIQHELGSNPVENGPHPETMNPALQKAWMDLCSRTPHLTHEVAAEMLMWMRDNVNRLGHEGFSAEDIVRRAYEEAAKIVAADVGSPSDLQ